jgi:aminoglycoside phosphotransferase (APT) family kinase protein
VRRANTRIPVPSIYHYNVNPANDFGAPYIIMEYVDGNVASELRETKGCALGLFGTAEQDRRFRQQMANIQVQLASCQFNQIGAIHEEWKTENLSSAGRLKLAEGHGALHPNTTPTS